MKKYFSYVVFCFLFSLTVNAQEAGIRFESGLTWQQIKNKAKEENKMIFVDCYATWCGPCKRMEQSIYPLKDVGDYFNTHFVNVKIQMDRTSKDEQAIRDWYLTADSLAKQFKITAYPTFLFFSSDGLPVHLIVGEAETGTEFIEKTSDALNPEKQYFTLLAGWQSHRVDSAYLLHAASAAEAAGDNENARMLMNNYIACVKEPITLANIKLIDRYINSESSNGFDLYLRNAAKIDQLCKKGYAEETMASAIFNDEILPLLLDKKAAINWKILYSNILAKYPSINSDLLAGPIKEHFQSAISAEIWQSVNNDPIHPAFTEIHEGLIRRFPGYDCGKALLTVEARYYFNKKSWDNCTKAAISLISQYGGQMSGPSINDMIWKCVFLHSSNKMMLDKAINQMKKVITLTPEDDYSLDTYANLLYKEGFKNKAIYWENKAIHVYAKQHEGVESKEDLAIVKKMELGQPTWNDGNE